MTTEQTMDSLSVSDLTRLLTVASDKEVNEFNAVYDQLDAANAMIAELEKDNKAYQIIAEKFDILEAQSNTILKNGEIHLQSTKQAYRERDQMKDQLKTANELLKLYKSIDTPKKIREKIKKYKIDAVTNLAAIAKSKTLIKDYRKELDKAIETTQQLKVAEVQNNMASIWNEDGDNLMIFPARLTMQIEDTQERQLTLLYMTASGCGKLIAIDEDGNPVECAVPEEGLNPKQRTLDVAGEILRKWRRQDWKLEMSDLDLKRL